MCTAAGVCTPTAAHMCSMVETRITRCPGPVAIPHNEVAEVTRRLQGVHTCSCGKWCDRNSGTLPPPMPMQTARPRAQLAVCRARAQWCRPATPMIDATACSGDHAEAATEADNSCAQHPEPTHAWPVHASGLMLSAWWPPWHKPPFCHLLPRLSLCTQRQGSARLPPSRCRRFLLPGAPAPRSAVWPR